MEICTLKKRKDFIRAAEKGQKVCTHSVLVQAAPNKSAEDLSTYTGFTTTKKLGKANVRNRARRRLRAIVRNVFPQFALEGYTYVLIGRFITAECPYAMLRKDTIYALKKLHKLLNAPDKGSENEVAVPPADCQH